MSASMEKEAHDPFVEGESEIRLVTTGETPEGKSYFAVDEMVPRLGQPWKPRFGVYKVWGHDDLPASLPTDGIPNFGPYRFPQANGVRIIVYEYPPRGNPATTPDPDLFAEFERLHGPGIEIIREASSPTHHKTDSIDIGFVLRGEIVLFSDDGAEVTLKAGDVLVQNGAMHTWENRTDETCLIGFVILGAVRS
jgi:hypothetical protein